MSDRLRAELWSVLYQAIQFGKIGGAYTTHLSSDWSRVLRSYWVEVLHCPVDEFKNEVNEQAKLLKLTVLRLQYMQVYDLFQFILDRLTNGAAFGALLNKAFERSSAAFRVHQRLIVPFTNEQEAKALMGALDATSAGALSPANSHLISAVKALRSQDWAGSVRESISAVESVAIVLAPGATTLGPALTRLEKDGQLHGALKSAFSALYGWTSDDEGIRHALVFKTQASVDEADAVFMLGACASFVSFLSNKQIALGAN